MWDPHGPGTEPVSPALADGFLAIGPPGKPNNGNLCLTILGGWKVQVHWAGRFRDYWGLASWFIDTCLLAVYLYGWGDLSGVFYMALNPIHEGSILMIQSPPKSPFLLIPSPWGFGFQHMNWEGHKHSDHRNLIPGKFPVPYETKSYFMNMASQTEISPRFECFNFCFGLFYCLICVSTFQHCKII